MKLWWLTTSKARYKILIICAILRGNYDTPYDDMLRGNYGTQPYIVLIT